jgi:hypothetical protein
MTLSHKHNPKQSKSQIKKIAYKNKTPKLLICKKVLAIKKSLHLPFAFPNKNSQ